MIMDTYEVNMELTRLCLVWFVHEIALDPRGGSPLHIPVLPGEVSQLPFNNTLWENKQFLDAYFQTIMFIP